MVGFIFLCVTSFYFDRIWLEIVEKNNKSHQMNIGVCVRTVCGVSYFLHHVIRQNNEEVFLRIVQVKIRMNVPYFYRASGTYLSV